MDMTLENGFSVLARFFLGSLLPSLRHLTMAGRSPSSSSPSPASRIACKRPRGLAEAAFMASELLLGFLGSNVLAFLAGVRLAGVAPDLGVSPPVSLTATPPTW
jgi:hypothetical protein